MNHRALAESARRLHAKAEELRALAAAEKDTSRQHRLLDAAHELEGRSLLGHAASRERAHRAL